MKAAERGARGEDGLACLRGRGNVAAVGRRGCQRILLAPGSVYRESRGELTDCPFSRDLVGRSRLCRESLE